MGWDQISDQQQNGQSGSPQAIEVQATKQSGNENLHSLFIKDFLLPSDNAPGKAPAPEAPPAVVAAPRESSNQMVAPARIIAPGTFSTPRNAEIPATVAAPPQAYMGPQSFAPVNGPGDYAPSYGPPGYAQTGERPPSNYPMQPPGRDMTYRSMSRAAMMAQGGYDRQQGQGMFPQDRPPQTAQELFAGLRNRRQQFQPQFVQQQRPELPPGAPQEQPRQKLFGRGLFRGADQPAKIEPMQKHEFLAKNETGIIKEIQLPQSFKEVPRDPNMPPGSDPIQREFQVNGSRSHVSMYEGRELQPDEQKALKAVLAKPGVLKPDTPAYDAACQLMGAGYHTFVNNPQVTVGKFNGRDALFLTDEDPQQKLVGHTVIVPSDKGQFVYAISFDGNKADFPAVKKGLDSIKFRPTPDTVAPPAPGPKRK
jgi:hypothetical protein